MTNRRKSPPLTWLRTFEAAGRLQSFKAAAKELSLSPSTVSHQIRDLESLLQQPLFIRGAQQVQLTPDGARMLKPLTEGFSLIQSAAALLSHDAQSLHIGAFPFVVNEILAPAANDLKQMLGLSQLVLSTETDKAGLSAKQAQSRLDVVIRYGAASARQSASAGLASLHLFDIALMPITAASDPPIHEAEELLTRPLIRVRGPFDGWQRWSDAFGITDPPANVVLETDSYHAAALAVARGEGVCFGIFPFMQPWVEQHRIQPLPGLACRLDEAAYLVFASHQSGNPVLSRLRDWLRQQLLA